MTLPCGMVGSNASDRLPALRPFCVSRFRASLSRRLTSVGTWTDCGPAATVRLTVSPLLIVAPAFGSWSTTVFGGCLLVESVLVIWTTSPFDWASDLACSKLLLMKVGTVTDWTAGLPPPASSRTTRKPTTARIASASRAEIQTHGLVPRGSSSYSSSGGRRRGGASAYRSRGGLYEPAYASCSYGTRPGLGRATPVATVAGLIGSTASMPRAAPIAARPPPAAAPAAAAAPTPTPTGDTAAAAGARSARYASRASRISPAVW